MTGVDVEHTKALIAEAIREVPLSRRRAITLDPPIAFKLVQQADALVAAVERVQALHTPWTNPTGELWCLECTRRYPCPTRRALEAP